MCIEKLKKNWDLIFLLLATSVLLLAMLNSNVLWTMESRWAAVVLQMQLKHDYLHPYIYNGPYYDKPLLSYWLIAIFAKLFGNLNEWALRLPSAISGFISVYCIYDLGKTIFTKRVGLLAGWLLLTTFFFVYWSRTASADMENVAGILLAVLWYFLHKENPSFKNYFIFFLITAVCSLSKGLLGFVLPALAILPDLLQNKEWKKHLNVSFFGAFFLAAFVYATPFIVSLGFTEVIRENVQRFFTPFDHENPFYTYFIYLPFYILPWTIFFIPAIFFKCKNWCGLQQTESWLLKTIFLVFLFFTLSGSRRGYYILPLVPFLILFTAKWLNDVSLTYIKFTTTFKSIIIFCYIALFIWFAGIQPYLSITRHGVWQLATELHAKIENTHKNWNDIQITVLNGSDDRIVFYLKPEKPVNNITEEELTKKIISNNLKNTIVVTTKNISENLLALLKKYNYSIIKEKKCIKNCAIAIFQVLS